jgi:hypothetical protein
LGATTAPCQPLLHPTDPQASIGRWRRTGNDVTHPPSHKPCSCRFARSTRATGNSSAFIGYIFFEHIVSIKGASAIIPTTHTTAATTAASSTTPSVSRSSGKTLYCTIQVPQSHGVGLDASGLPDYASTGSAHGRRQSHLPHVRHSPYTRPVPRSRNSLTL